MSKSFKNKLSRPMRHTNRVASSASQQVHVAHGSWGFTIIELLIAIGVMGIALPSMSVALANMVAINNRSRDLALANIIAGNKAEQIRSAGFNSLSAGTTSFTSELPAALASPKSGSYSVSYPTAGVAEVTLTITYKDYTTTRTLTYKTLVSELGVGQ